MEEKHFREWIDLKEKLHFSDSIPLIKEGDIWWCSCENDIRRIKNAVQYFLK